MKLYCSSYRLGDEAEKLREMFAGTKVGIIQNALDFSEDYDRLNRAFEREYLDLEALGLTPEKLNLRNYFGKEDKLQEKLGSLDGVWVVGGNAFVLRRAMKFSGMDNILIENNLKADFVYAGYSAGICVLSPSLRGIEIVDPQDVVPEGYGKTVIWEGLNIVPLAFAPHFDSQHPESELINEVMSFFNENGIDYLALRDGEVFISTYR